MGMYHINLPGTGSVYVRGPNMLAMMSAIALFPNWHNGLATWTTYSHVSSVSSAIKILTKWLGGMLMWFRIITSNLVALDLKYIKKIEKPPNEVAKRDPYMSPQYDVAVVMKPSPPVSDACCTLDLINYRYVCLQQLQKSSFLVIRRAFIRSYAIE